MKLSINADEIKVALLEWAEKELGNKFNHVEFEFSYGSFEEAIFSKKEPVIEVPCQVNAEPQ